MSLPVKAPAVAAYIEEALAEIDDPLRRAQVRNVLELMEEGTGQGEAAAESGMTPSAFTQLKAKSELIQMAVTQARARAKGILLRTVHRAATRGFTVREKRTRKFLGEEGESIVEQTDIERETAPDARVAMRLLQMAHPEDFGSISRVDAKKIGGSGQVDGSGDPSAPDDPLATINMILDGDGTFVPQDKDALISMLEKNDAIAATPQPDDVPLE